jgi:hypothetical protein
MKFKTMNQDEMLEVVSNICINICNIETDTNNKDFDFAIENIEFHLKIAKE